MESLVSLTVQLRPDEVCVLKAEAERLNQLYILPDEPPLAPENVATALLTRAIEALPKAVPEPS